MFYVSYERYQIRNVVYDVGMEYLPLTGAKKIELLGKRDWPRSGVETDGGSRYTIRGVRLTNDVEFVGFVRFVRVRRCAP